VDRETGEHITLCEILALAHWGQAFAYAERDVNLEKALELIKEAQQQIRDTFGENNTAGVQFLAKYLDCKGWIHYKLDKLGNKPGNIDEAIANLEQAVALTAHAEIYLHLALAYESKWQKTTDKMERQTMLTKTRVYCQHAQVLDINGQNEQQIKALLQRIEENSKPVYI